MDAARLPPSHEKRRSRAVAKTVTSNHRTSVGVTEIKAKIAENVRKYAYYEALMTAEDTHIHNEPVDVREAQERPNWPQWKVAMCEELDSLKQHSTYKRVEELPPGRKAVRFKWVFKLKLNLDNSIA